MATRLEHGWELEDGTYICDGCNAQGAHEHRCHRQDGSRTCDCESCQEPTQEQLDAFMREARSG